MHEISLAVAILDIVEEYAAKDNFQKVNSIRLSFGRLTCIEPKTLAFAFEVQSGGTRAEGAKLNLEILPVSVHCLACETDSEMEAFSGSCPKCGSEQLMITGGREDLKIIDMEVD
jgi:hydrogenase nickel incorporation protein HypA/HybF